MNPSPTQPSRTREHSLTPYLAGLLLLLVGMLVYRHYFAPPSEDAGRALLGKRIMSQSDNKIMLTKFRKTNGIVNGGSYQMEFEADIVFMANGVWMRGSSLDSAVSFEFSTDKVPANNIGQLMAGVTGAMNVFLGQHQTVKGTLQFQKSERGWMGEDGKIY